MPFFPLALLTAPTRSMRELFELMSRQHGIATCAQSRQLGVTRAVERRLILSGTLSSPFPGVLAAAGVPTAMMFVRNPTGVSHSPDELATMEDCLLGVEALADALAELVT